MNIQGLQKLTLLDYPGHTACTVFLGGCDFSCPFCHNSDLIGWDAPAIMDENELFSFLKKREGILDGVAITGGEPLLRKELPYVCARIKDAGFLVKLDTNGNHPRALEKILEAGVVDYIAMDIKNSPERYAETIGLPAFDTGRISESISLLLDGSCEYEFRTTVTDQLHDAASFRAIGPWIHGAKRYFLQAFTDRDSVRFAGFSAPSREKMEHFAEIVQTHVNRVELRGI